MRGQYLDSFRVNIKVEILEEELPAQSLYAEALWTLTVVPKPHEGKAALRAVAESHLQKVVALR